MAKKPLMVNANACAPQIYEKINKTKIVYSSQKSLYHQQWALTKNCFHAGKIEKFAVLTKSVM